MRDKIRSIKGQKGESFWGDFVNLVFLCKKIGRGLVFFRTLVITLRKTNF